MDPNIWGRLPSDITNRIICEYVKSEGVHPFADEIKTLNLLNDVLNIYVSCYGDDIAYDWLAIDLDNFRDGGDLDEGNWGVHKKWRKLTPAQRRDFFERISV